MYEEVCMIWLAVGLGSVAAGFLQTVTGFGSATVLMLILSVFFDMTAAPALSSAICMGLAMFLAWRFRRALKLSLVLMPALIYTAASIAAIRLAANVDLQILSGAFGIFLILLSVYFLLFESKINLTGSPVSMAACSAVSGVCAGLFSIGGPTMALYYLAATKRREEYLANIQCLFALTYAAGLPARISSGAYTLRLLPLTVLGIAGILAGSQLGLGVEGKLDGKLIKKLIFIYIGITGLLTCLRQIL